MENRFLRAIGMGIAGTLVLLFVLPAILRLLMVAAVISVVYRIVKRRYLYKSAAYFAYQDRQNYPNNNFELPNYVHLNRNLYHTPFGTTPELDQTIVKIG